MSNEQWAMFGLLIAHCSLLIAHWRLATVHGRFMESLHALSSTHWDHEPERGRSLAAARRQLGGLRKTRTPWSWRERCARGPGALRVQRFMESERRRTAGCCGRFPSRLNKNRCADRDELQQVFDVPVGQAKAAVGLGAAHVFGLGRPVNAVTGLIQAEPDGADRVVRAGLKNEFAAEFLRFGGFGKHRRIECVIWVERRG